MHTKHIFLCASLSLLRSVIWSTKKVIKHLNVKFFTLHLELAAFVYHYLWTRLDTSSHARAMHWYEECIRKKKKKFLNLSNQSCGKHSTSYCHVVLPANSTYGPHLSRCSNEAIPHSTSHTTSQMDICGLGCRLHSSPPSLMKANLIPTILVLATPQHSANNNDKLECVDQ